MITTEFIFMMATIVFLLMVIGIILTVQEFSQLSDDSAQLKRVNDKPVTQRMSLHH